MALKTFICPDCGKEFLQNSWRHSRCTLCAQQWQRSTFTRARSTRRANKKEQS